MSQRLLISKKTLIDLDEDGFYDAIYTEKSTFWVLLHEWCRYKNGFYIGPWQITIRSASLMDMFLEDFKILTCYTPHLQSFDDVWKIFDSSGQLCHLSTKEDNKIRDTLNFLDDPKSEVEGEERRWIFHGYPEE
jgi:hypothetical protein